MLRAIELERCKSAAPASVPEPDRQWFCSKAERVVTYADRALSILGYNRNDEFHSTVSGVLRVANTTPASSTAKVELKAHAVRQVAEVMSAASMRYRAFIGAPSCVPFPAFTNAADKATAMQTQAKAARHLVTSIGVVMPSMLHSAAAATGDDDDDDGSGGGKLSKSAKKKAARALSDAQQANRDAKQAQSARRRRRRRRRQRQARGGGGGGGSGAPGDLAGRVNINGDSVTFHWPKGAGPNGKRQATKRSPSMASRKSSPPPASQTSALASSASRSSSCTRCRRPSPTTTSGWRTPTASATTRATSTTTPSQPARTSSCPGSTAPC